MNPLPNVADYEAMQNRQKKEWRYDKMNSFEFKCPQCGQPVRADDSLCGLTVSCPHCEKGIVVPQKKRKPILAPISHGETATRETDYAMRAIERRMGKPISEQSIMEEAEMDNTHHISTVDLLKIIGLIIVMGVVIFDVFSIRSQNKVLRETIETQKVEMERKLSSVTAKRDYYERMLRNAEQAESGVRSRVQEKEARQAERIMKMEEGYRKDLEERRNQADRMRTTFENKMREMRESFIRERERLQAELRSVRELYALAQENSRQNSSKEDENGGNENIQNSPKRTITELKSQIKANQDEINHLRVSNPGFILVDRAKQARILETRFRPSGLGKYCANGQITYVRSQFRCSACKWEGSESGGPCCDVSRKRSFNLWRSAMYDAQKTAEINARIDELLKENEDLKKAMYR